MKFSARGQHQGGVAFVIGFGRGADARYGYSVVNARMILQLSIHGWIDSAVIVDIRSPLGRSRAHRQGSRLNARRPINLFVVKITQYRQMDTERFNSTLRSSEP